jgi:hypothetical protein
MNVSEQSEVIDDRPIVSFNVIDGLEEGGTVFVDGLPAGLLKKYLHSDNHGLRLISGKHLISVMRHGATIHQEEIFLLEGTKRTILVN